MTSLVIGVRAAGVCFPDLLLSKGEYQLKLPPPFIPGMEAAGVVEWAPEDSEFTVGDRVSAFGILGGFAEQVLAPVANVTRSPAELDDAEAVSLLVNYNTMYFALARRAAMRQGDSVLVLGSAGGVGSAAIQVARAMGASKVIAVVHRTSATDFVESLGADVVLPLADGWAQAVREHTDGRGVDIVVDPVGGQAFDDAVRVLAIDGKLLVIGFAAGAIPTVKVNRLLLRNVGVLGVAWGEYLHQVPGSAGLFAFGPQPTGVGWIETTSAATVSAVARSVTRCSPWPTAGCSARWCWSPRTACALPIERRRTPQRWRRLPIPPVL